MLDDDDTSATDVETLAKSPPATVNVEDAVTAPARVDVPETDSVVSELADGPVGPVGPVTVDEAPVAP